MLLSTINNIDSLEGLKKVLKKKLRGESVGFFEGQEIYSLPNDDVAIIHGNNVYVHFLGTGKTALARIYDQEEK